MLDSSCCLRVRRVGGTDTSWNSEFHDTLSATISTFREVIFIDLVFLESTERLGSFCRRVFSFDIRVFAPAGGVAGPLVSGHRFLLDHCNHSFSEFGPYYQVCGLS